MTTREATTVKHIVALSGGKDSTAMALRLQEIGDHDYEFICTPTGNELPEMVDHWLKIGKLLGKPLLPVTMGKSIQGESRRQKCLPNSRMRWCTRILKLEPFSRYLMQNLPCVSYVGIRADETATRDGVDWEALDDGVTNRYPLVEWGWGVKHVMRYLDEKGVTIPTRTDCAMCFYQRLGEWWRLWKNYPEQYSEAAQLETDIGHTLRSKDRDTWPASLVDLGAEFQRGNVPKGADQLDFELSIEARSTMCSFCAR